MKTVERKTKLRDERRERRKERQTDRNRQRDWLLIIFGAGLSYSGS